MATGHPLDVLFDVAASDGEVEIPPGWGQGRATFGGLVTGVLLSHAHGATGLDAADLRSATTSFVAPVAPGRARLTATVLRRGSSAAQVQTSLLQADEDGQETTRAVLLASFGAPRDSAIRIQPVGPAGPLPEATAMTPLPWLPGLTPDFFAHVDLRIATGGLPFSGAPGGDLTGHMRFRTPPRALTPALGIALIDAWPPAPGQMFAAPTRMSTLAWTVELLAPLPPDPESFWWYEVNTDAAHAGYGHTHARVFAADGTPIAISRQTISLFG